MMRKYSSRDIHILEIVRFDWTGGGALLGGYGNYMIRLASLFSVVYYYWMGQKKI